MKKGYKQTEIGIIPEDWEVTSLKKVCSEKLQNGVFYKPSKKGRGIKLINVGDLYKKIPINVEELEMFDAEIEEEKKFKVLNGDLFFTRSSIVPSGIAHCNIYLHNTNEKVVFDSHVIKARPNIKIVNPSYLFRYFISKAARNYLISQSKTSTMTTIDQGVLEKCPIALPPLPEQTAIAEALSDTDELLTTLEKLIEKKKLIKKGTMQELLTGKTRLPGFNTYSKDAMHRVSTGVSTTIPRGYRQTEVGLIPEDWEVKKLGDVLKVRHGKSQKEIICRNGKYPILATGGNVGETNTYIYDKPSVLIGRKGTIDKPQYMDKPFWAIDTIFYTEIDNGISPKFIFYKFNSIDWYSYNEASGVPSLNAKRIESIKIPLPSLPEQTAIAETLSDMDSEIEMLEKKLEKTKQIKQGMMQELLTGKTRLV